MQAYPIAGVFQIYEKYVARLMMARIFGYMYYSHSSQSARQKSAVVMSTADYGYSIQTTSYKSYYTHAAITE